MNLTEEQIRAILACSGFELMALEEHQAEPHLLQCDCDDCLNGSKEVSK